MGMTLHFKPDLLEAAIAQLGDRAIKGMSGKMREVAYRMRDLAREYAPVKTGLLEESIHAGEKRGARGRLSFVVFIDLDAARIATKKDGEPKDGVLGDYAYIMEEQLRPHGRGGPPLQLGAISRQKAAGGKKVGGRFLARAFSDATKNLHDELVDEVRRVLGRPRSSGVSYVRDTGDNE